MRRRIAARSIAGSLALAACGSGPFSTDDNKTGETSDDLACIDENGLVPGVLRLELMPARAWLIDGGAVVELPLEGDEQPEKMLGSAAGDYIAIARIDEQSGEENTKVHVFSRSSGERLWMRDIDDGASTLHMSDDGWLSVSTGGWNTSLGFVMSEAATIDLPNYAPLGPPTLGHVAALGNSDGWGWLDLDDLSWQPITLPSVSSYGLTVADDHHTIEYVTFIDGAFAFVRERPGETDIFTLPFVVPEEPVDVVARNGRYRVVRRARYWLEPPDIDHVRIDIQTGDLELVDPEKPQYWAFFDCMERRTSVDDVGRLYFELRRGSSAQAWAYDVVDEAWTAMGHPLSLIEDIHVRAVSRDLLLVGGSVEGDCMDAEWTEPPVDALLGNSVQLVRRESALTMVLPDTPLRIDQQQRCVALIEDDGWKVRALDGSGAVLELGPGVGDWLWLD
jgi:hypothetical protein